MRGRVDAHLVVDGGAGHHVAVPSFLGLLQTQQAHDVAAVHVVRLSQGGGVDACLRVVWVASYVLSGSSARCSHKVGLADGSET